MYVCLPEVTVVVPVGDVDVGGLVVPGLVVPEMPVVVVTVVVPPVGIVGQEEKIAGCLSG